MEQVELQPSPLVALPSSQASEAFFWPSPQMGAHTLGVPAQVKPGSMEQVELQPSPLAPLPSSQASVPAVAPSPQSVAHALGEPAQV